MLSFLTGNTSANKYGAAKNALLAKHLFLQLDEERMMKVVVKVTFIYQRGARCSIDQAKRDMSGFNEATFCAFLAFAFAEMNEPPPLPGMLFKNKWDFTISPLTALDNAEAEIDMAIREIQRKFDINMTLDTRMRSWMDVLPIP